MNRYLKNFGWYIQHLKTRYALFLIVFWPMAFMALWLVFRVGSKKTWAEEQGII